MSGCISTLSTLGNLGCATGVSSTSTCKIGTLLILPFTGLLIVKFVVKLSEEEITYETTSK